MTTAQLTKMLDTGLFELANRDAGQVGTGSRTTVAGCLTEGSATIAANISKWGKWDRRSARLNVWNQDTFWLTDRANMRVARAYREELGYISGRSTQGVWGGGGATFTPNTLLLTTLAQGTPLPPDLLLTLPVVGGICSSHRHR